VNETRFYNLRSLLRRVIRTRFRENRRGSSTEEGRVGSFVRGENERVGGNRGTDLTKLFSLRRKREIEGDSENLRGALDLNPRLSHVENVKFLCLSEGSEYILFESKFLVRSFNVEFTASWTTLLD